MDVNDLRSVVTVVSLLVFVGIVRWAWARHNQSAFAEAANLPFAEDTASQAGQQSNEGSRP